MNEHSKWMDSIEAKQQRLTAQYQTFANTFLNSSLIKGTYDAGTGILGWLTDIVDIFGSFPTMIATVIPFFDKLQMFQANPSGKGLMLSWNTKKLDLENDIKLLGMYNDKIAGLDEATNDMTQRQVIWNDTIGRGSNTLKDSIRIIDDTTVSTSAYRAETQRATASTAAFGVASKALAIGLRTALNMAIGFGIGLAIQAAATAVTNLVNASENARKKAIEVTHATNEQIKSLDSLKDQYEQIINSTKDETEKTKDLDTWKKALIETYGFEKEAIEGVNLQREKSLDLLNKEIWAAKKRAVEEGIVGMGDEYDKAVAAFESPKPIENRGLGIDYSEETGVSQGVINRLREYNIEIEKTNTLNGTLTYSYLVNADSLTKQKEALAGAYTALKDKQNKTEAEITLMEFLKSEYDAVTKTYDTFIDNYTEGTKLIAQKTVIDAFEDGTLAAVDSVESYNKLSNQLVELAGSSEILKDAIVNELAAQFPELAKAAKEAIDESTGGVARYVKSLANLKDVLSGVQNAYSILELAQQDINDNNSLSIDTVQKLADITDDYINYLVEENGQLHLNTTAWKNMADAKIRAEMVEIQHETDSLREENEQLEKTILSLRAIPITDDVVRAEIKRLTESISENNSMIQENQGLLTKYELLFNSMQSIDLSNITNGLDALTLATDGMSNIISAIDKYSDSMSTLVSIQEALANSFTITLAQAKEFASVYPEILNGATVSADGQIVLNEAVANSFIEAKRIELDAEVDIEIAKLEAEKMKLEAKKSSAEAQLKLANAVAEGEVDIENAKVQLLADAEQVLTQYLIDLGVSEVDAQKSAAEAKAGNMEEYARIVGNVADDNANNLAQSMVSAANATKNNVVAMVSSLDSLGRQAANVAAQISKIGTGETTYNGSVSVGGGGVGNSSFSPTYGNYNFSGIDAKSVDALDTALGEWKKNLELDISGYTSAIAQINGQISALNALKSLPIESYKGGLGGSKGGSGGNAQKEIEEYIATINKLYAAEERLKDIQEKRGHLETQVEITGDTNERLDYMNQIIDLYKQEQDALHKINELRRKQINDNVTKLREVGFNVDYDSETNHLFINNLEHINKLVGSTTEETNELRKSYEDLISSTIGLNDANKDNSNSWLDIQKSILDAREAIYNEWFDNEKYEISVLERSDADKRSIINSWREVLNGIQDEIEYWTQLGYDTTSDKIQSLTKDLWEVEDAISGTLDAIITEANDSLDNIQNISDTLSKAAQEFAESGFITVDTFQSIASLGVEYLAYLVDENGQLVINEQAIQKVIAAKTQQVAVETALNYVQALRTALTEGDITTLEHLLFATDAATGSTWDLVYAQLAMLELNDQQYKAALTRINTLRTLADTACQSIGKITGTVTESLKEQQQALDDLLKYVIEMIKWEVNNQIDGLKEQVKQYKSIVDLQKESLRIAKEKDGIEKTVAKKINSIAELQSRINQLSLDDSREAQTEKKKLEQELAELQEELADYQADYAYDAQVEMLDKMVDEYEESKNQEIKILEDSISSYQKLYDMAINRISTQWDTLYRDLTNWNYNYGNVTTDTITSAWNTASSAVQRYGSYLEAVLQTQNQLMSMSNSISSSDYNSSTSSQSSNVVGNTGNYDTSGSNTMSQIKSIVSQMKSNSSSWAASSSDAQKQQLANTNISLASQLSLLLGRSVVIGSDGHWYLDRIGGTKLYDVYHKGGVVGGMATPKDNEVYALLEKDENVFTKEQKEAAYDYIDVGAQLMNILDKLGSSKLSLPPVLMNAIGAEDTSTTERFVESVTNNSDNSSVGDITVSVESPILVTERLTKDDILEHSKTIANIANDAIESNFSKVGLKNTHGRTWKN